MVAALLVFVLFCWLYALLAVLVRTKLGRPVLFRQERPGRGGKIFTLCKFRTMTDRRGADGRLLPDSERMTKFGIFLRRTSLDELPEFWNILKGEMSVVGPRPLLPEYLPWYTEEESHRHDVRPGLTGLAQISGRNSLDWDSRLAKDVAYVNGISFALDARIVWATAAKVFGRTDPNAAADTAKEGNLAQIRRQKKAADGVQGPG
ncbi:MAG: sugar transferase [Lachnospiraceae bacterium]|nr:sugar transferase [Lachnospiraceae bacterium]